MKRNVLLIANYSVKAEAFVQYWPDDMWDLHLYSYQKNEWFAGMSDRFGAKWIAHLPEKSKYRFAGDRSIKKTKKKNASRTYIQKKRKIRRFLQHRLLRLYKQNVLNWGIPNIIELKAKNNWVRPDLVISVYEPFAANLIARQISNFYKIPWIAYFRDHCTTYREMIRVPGLWHLQSVCDRWINSSANRLVGVSQQFVDILSRYYDISPKNAHVITGGFNDSNLPEDIRNRCIKRRFASNLSFSDRPNAATPLKVSYIGKLYKHQVQSLLLIFNALLVLLNNKVPVEFRLILSNASYFFPKQVKLAIEKLEQSSIRMNFSPIRIDYRRALEVLEVSDVNTIVEGLNPPHNTTGTVTGKIFDLMMIAKPVVAVCASSLPIGNYLHETGIGTNCENTEDIVNALMEVWRSKNGEDIPKWYFPDGYAIEKYSYKSMAKQMHNLCEDTYNKTLADIK